MEKRGHTHYVKGDDETLGDYLQRATLKFQDGEINHTEKKEKRIKQRFRKQNHRPCGRY